ncbi:MAG: hypothetical protein MNSN_00280 [Minisyncoccus archaeiphilus]|uniref:SLOG cluster 4 domain-containing protein n=1 Tax=Minisyncoccus archaeiphilus TaxID=3238481 RepID=UPI0009C48578|nr:MAG: hypothetical protein BWY21_00205 [Parcubacteria group bacterium ADurb.Bin216]GMX59034.1 MAG: hypothetical protein MNSN_00280 [Candidatus Parcubacteria bacterium]
MEEKEKVVEKKKTKKAPIRKNSKVVRKNFNIVVSGAAVMDLCCDDIREVAKEVGSEIAKKGHTLVTGATSGVPYFSAIGCHEAGGRNIGFSPAESKIEHVKRYRLPTEPFDVIVYTGSDYVGRNIIMTKSADGVIVICGRTGTLHEFATAVECGKPIGILEKSGGTADKIKYLLDESKKIKSPIVFERDPKVLVEKLLKLVEADEVKADKILNEAKKPNRRR